MRAIELQPDATQCITHGQQALSVQRAELLAERIDLDQQPLDPLTDRRDVVHVASSPPLTRRVDLSIVALASRVPRTRWCFGTAEGVACVWARFGPQTRRRSRMDCRITTATRRTSP